MSEKNENKRKVAEVLARETKWLGPPRRGSAITACGKPFPPGLGYVEVDGKSMGVNTPAFMDNVNNLFNEMVAEQARKIKAGVNKGHPAFKQAPLYIIRDRITKRIRLAHSLAVNWTEKELKEASGSSKPCPDVGEGYEEWVKMIDHINSTFHRLHGKRDVVIYTSDGIAIFYLFRGGLDMHLTEKDRPVLLKDHILTSLARRNLSILRVSLPLETTDITTGRRLWKLARLQSRHKLVVFITMAAGHPLVIAMLSQPLIHLGALSVLRIMYLRCIRTWDPCLEVWG